MARQLGTPVPQPGKGPSSKGGERGLTPAVVLQSPRRCGDPHTCHHTPTQTDGSVNVFVKSLHNVLLPSSPRNCYQKSHLTCTAFLAWPCPAPRHIFSTKYSEACTPYFSFYLILAPPKVRGLFSLNVSTSKARFPITPFQSR